MKKFYRSWRDLVTQEIGFATWYYSMSAMERLTFLELNRDRIGECVSSKIRYYRRKCGLPISSNYKHRVRSDAEFEYMLFLRERGVTYSEIARRQGVTPSVISAFIEKRTWKKNDRLARELVLYPMLKSILEHESPPPRQAVIASLRNLNEQ